MKKKIERGLDSGPTGRHILFSIHYISSGNPNPSPSLEIIGMGNRRKGWGKEVMVKTGYSWCGWEGGGGCGWDDKKVSVGG